MIEKGIEEKSGNDSITSNEQVVIHEKVDGDRHDFGVASKPKAWESKIKSS